MAEGLAIQMRARKPFHGPSQEAEYGTRLDRTTWPVADEVALRLREDAANLRDRIKQLRQKMAG